MILTLERRRPCECPRCPPDQWDDAVDRALAVMLPEERRNPENASNILGTFVNHPDLTKEFLKFNVHLLFHSTLPPRLRELAILRVAHRTDSAYEWMQHVKMGLREGLTDEDIAGVQRGDAVGCLRPHGADARSTNYSSPTTCRMRRGRRSASASTSGSGWTSSSRSAVTSPCPWL